MDTGRTCTALRQLQCCAARMFNYGLSTTTTVSINPPMISTSCLYDGPRVLYYYCCYLDDTCYSLLWMLQSTHYYQIFYMLILTTTITAICSTNWHYMCLLWLSSLLCFLWWTECNKMLCFLQRCSDAIQSISIFSRYVTSYIVHRIILYDVIYNDCLQCYTVIQCFSSSGWRHPAAVSLFTVRHHPAAVFIGDIRRHRAAQPLRCVTPRSSDIQFHSSSYSNNNCHCYCYWYFFIFLGHCIIAAISCEARSTE